MLIVFSHDDVKINFSIYNKHAFSFKSEKSP